MKCRSLSQWLGVVTATVCALTSATSRADGVFDDTLVQAPTLAGPEAASIAGSLAKTAFGPTELVRGAFTLPGSLSAPEERGPLLAKVFPSYSPENGLSEWGMGWQTSLAITRFRVAGDLDYATDEFATPWGRVRQGNDGNYYPLGLSTPVRLSLDEQGWTAVLPDGTRYLFSAAIETASGVYQWVLSEVSTLQGDRTELSYAYNKSGRPFLQFVHYGGRSETKQVEIEFQYKYAPFVFADYRSGERLELDCRVSGVVVRTRAGGSGAFALRWQYDLEYETSTYSPAFYLIKVTRTFASGESEPALTYQYDYGDEHFNSAAFEHFPALDEYLNSAGDVGLYPDRVAIFDLEKDGVLEMEHRYSFTLVQKTDDGFKWQLLPEEEDADTLCRPAPATHNRPRTLSRLTPDAEETEVLATIQYSGSKYTEFHICDRLGKAKQVDDVEGQWLLNEANTRFVVVLHK